jgi:predicted site-specific integrase-resolvase
MSVQIDRVIPLRQAAKKASVSVKVLQSLVESGKLEAVKLPDGEIAVNERDLAQAKPVERDESLRGKPISASDAVAKYKVPRSSIADWIRRGYITVIRPGYGMELDESDVKLCADIHHQHKAVGSRAPLFDKKGKPYQLKDAVMAAYRRGLRHAQRERA